MTEITARLRIATGIVPCAICEASRLRDGLDNEGDTRANPEAQRLSTPDEVKPSATLADEVSDLVHSLDGQGVDRTSVLQGDHSSSPLADDAGAHSVGDGPGAGMLRLPRRPRSRSNASPKLFARHWSTKLRRIEYAMQRSWFSTRRK